MNRAGEAIDEVRVVACATCPRGLPAPVCTPRRLLGRWCMSAVIRRLDPASPVKHTGDWKRARIRHGGRCLACSSSGGIGSLGDRRYRALEARCEIAADVDVAADGPDPTSSARSFCRADLLSAHHSGRSTLSVCANLSGCRRFETTQQKRSAPSVVSRARNPEDRLLWRSPPTPTMPQRHFSTSMVESPGGSVAVLNNGRGDRRHTTRLT